MKLSSYFLRQFTVIFLLILSLPNAEGSADFGCHQDATQNVEATTTITTNSEDYVEDEMGSLFLLVLLVVVMMICFGIGFAITLIGLFVVGGLILLGVLSVSVLVSFYQKSLASGLKTMVYLSAAVGGTIFGGLSAFLFNKILHWSSSQLVIIIGSIGGIMTGLLFAHFILFISNKAYVIYLKKREISNY